MRSWVRVSSQQTEKTKQRLGGRGRPCEDRSRDLEPGVAGSHQELEEVGQSFPCSLWREHSLGHLDVGLLTAGEHFCRVKSPVVCCGHPRTVLERHFPSTLLQLCLIQLNA